MVEHDTICKKGLYALYYAFYVVIEGIFKVSHSWNPTISITGIISLLVAIPLIRIIRLLSLYWVGIDIPMKVSTIVGIIIYGCFYWLSYHYYISADKIIKNKFQRGSILGKIAFGMLAIVIICASIFISYWASELYITKWKMLG